MLQESMIEYGYRRIIITMVVMLCAILELLDVTIVNVALNDLQGNLGATLTEVGWVATAYAIGNVIIIPMTSWLSQQFGRTHYFAGSIVLFTICSFLCGQSNNIFALSVFRFLQGMGGGALLATSQTIITEIYPTEKRGQAQAIFTLGVIIGPSLGPILGGYIIDNYSWPMIFYINVPLGIIAALLSFQYIRSPQYGSKKSAREVDWMGILLLAAAIGSLQFVLERGQEEDWFNSEIITILSVIAFFGIFFFIWRELTCTHPIVNLRVLHNKNLLMATILSFIYGFGSYGSTFIVPLFTQSQLGWPATDAGLLVAVSSISSIFVLPVVTRLNKMGVKPQYLLAAGMLLFAFNCYWSRNILTPHTDIYTFFTVLLFRYIALNFFVVSISNIAFATIKTNEIADGAAFTGMLRQLGGSFGIAVITTYISRQQVFHRNTLVSHLVNADPAVQHRLLAVQQSFQGKGMPVNIAVKSSYKLLDISVNQQATILSYMDVYLAVSMLFLLAVPFVLLTKSAHKSAPAADLH
ncbi:DHA2 family efflux MFS transporter permease subunit [Chitinophaga nivalis]|uniref:DHA2 family efflux MFS transporter permease subunit n=1 Tax=Chitinophaga nivalis TaxID=2991709 RepID=A0ABT3IN80_9BACT|nr:DHA2 family efflux MFS transporter permease subunit [Chitinophaga nivalis]MCW3464895.1 DHA2 family efflux MFS transporter permease subunit [Chitinophaga nivalis]MCW3485414.1 DHA2 family efflux MFS transporter permease subunit [Chitinophaga nivalis]